MFDDHMSRNSTETAYAIGQWIILVLVKGGRDYITPPRRQYTWYISGIYCQLGDYILPTTLYKNQNNPLNWWRYSISLICHKIYH